MPDIPKQYFLYYFPYLTMRDVEEIDFGFIKIWNFDKKKDAYISDPALKAKITQILANYQSQFYPVRGIGIASIGTNDFRKFTPEEAADLHTAKYILFISALAYNNLHTANVNIGHAMFSSENFESMIFSMVLDSEYMSEPGGFVINMLHGGIEISKNLQKTPSYILNPSRLNLDVDLFNTLIKLRKRRPKFFKRLISAIEVFYESYYNSPQVSEKARILLLTSAFEMLLQSEPGAGREKTKNFIALHANVPEDRKYSYYSERRGGVVRESGTRKEIWADRFFSLRNHIAHGDIVPKTEFLYKSQRHFDIAPLFFVFTLKKKIDLYLRRDIFGDEIEWKKWTDENTIPITEYEGFAYNATKGKLRKLFNKLRKRKRP
ncbi:MAG TPA: hypothetical protein VFQ72_02280 [Candidatus Paceibacterota bacterium]|nr:hypothetical protein [Candidatus Paceibacterota bacterium]